MYSKNKKNGEGKMYNSDGLLILSGRWDEDLPPQWYDILIDQS